jgi:hypothetical protein
MAPALRRPIRYLGLIYGIPCLAAALGFPASIGWAQAQPQAQAQPAAPDNSAARINAEFQAVKERAVAVRLELPHLDQARLQRISRTAPTCRLPPRPRPLRGSSRRAPCCAVMTRRCDARRRA